MTPKSLEGGNDNQVRFEDAITSGKKIKDIPLGEKLYSLVSYKEKFFLIAPNNISFPGLDQGFDGLLGEGCSSGIKVGIETARKSRITMESKTEDEAKKRIENEKIPDYHLIVKGNQIFYVYSDNGEERLERMMSVPEKVEILKAS